MNSNIISLLLLLFLLSCSKKPSEAERRANIQPLPTLPFKITAVVPPETREQTDIQRRAADFFKKKNYDELDALATNIVLQRKATRTEHGSYHLFTTESRPRI